MSCQACQLSVKYIEQDVLSPLNEAHLQSSFFTILFSCIVYFFIDVNDILAIMSFDLLFFCVLAYKEKIGFNGQLLIEPKPKEPSKHQYDYG